VSNAYIHAPKAQSILIMASAYATVSYVGLLRQNASLIKELDRSEQNTNKDIWFVT